MSWEATAAAKKIVTGAPARKLVLFCLADSHNAHTGLCCPSQDTLAIECEMTDRSIRTHLKALEQSGLIRVKPRRDDSGHRSSNEYELLFLPEEFSGGDVVLPETERKPTGKLFPVHKEPKEEPKGLNSGKTDSDAVKQAFIDSIWKPYPDKTNNDRKRALAVWRKMTPAKRQAAVASIPVYSAYCKANAWYRPLHVERYLGGRYEAHLPASDGGNPFLEKYGLSSSTHTEAAE